MKFPYILYSDSQIFNILPHLFFHSFYLCVSIFFIFSALFEGLCCHTSSYLLLLPKYFLGIREFSYIL